jgi:hypothetical protein
MAFNFGAFVGGLSQGVVRGIEDEEQRQHEFEKMAKTEAMRQAAAIRGKRAAKQEATEAAIGALKFVGYSDQAAAAIARQGAVAVEMAVDAGQQAMKLGKDVNTMISLPNVGENIEESNEELQDSIKGPKKPRVGIFDAEQYRNLYADPDEIANSYTERLAHIAQKQAKLDPESDEYQDLQNQEDQILKKVAAHAEALREKKDPDEPDPSLFSLGTVEATVGGVRAGALSEFKFELTDIDRGIAKRVDGDEGRYGVAMLRVAEELDATYGSLNDKIMNDRITFQRQEAVKNLTEYGRATAANTDSTYRKEFTTGQDALQAVQSKQVRIGDVIIWNDNGVQKIAVYTGFNDPETGVPLVMAD